MEPLRYFFFRLHVSNLDYWLPMGKDENDSISSHLHISSYSSISTYTNDKLFLLYCQGCNIYISFCDYKFHSWLALNLYVKGFNAQHQSLYNGSPFPSLWFWFMSCLASFYYPIVFLEGLRGAVSWILVCLKMLPLFLKDSLDSFKFWVILSLRTW